jgi:hypothetical protein
MQATAKRFIIGYAVVEALLIGYALLSQLNR